MLPGVATAWRFPMRLITLLNHCQHFSGFVYVKARLLASSQTIEIDVRSRRGSNPVCSGCHKRAPAYDHLGLRRFEFVPMWGFIVLLLYRMRRVDCRDCGVRVEELPWAIGKHQLTKAHMRLISAQSGRCWYWCCYELAELCFLA
jgi:transposase